MNGNILRGSMSSASTRNNYLPNICQFRVSRFLLSFSAVCLLFLSVCNFPSENIAATAAYLHSARKYNSEWINSEGSLTLVHDGWQAVSRPGNYAGLLVKDGQQVLVGPSSKEYTWITR